MVSLRVSATFLALMAALLAGCATGPGAPQATTKSNLASVQWNVETGAVAGTVVDSSMLPVSGALVVLDGTESTNTTIEGEFGFSFVEPGRHELTASA